MIAKVIAYAPNRYDCIRKKRRALQELVLLGLTTNKDFLIQILQNQQFITGHFDTHFLGKSFTYSPQHLSDQHLHQFAIAALLHQWQQRRNTLQTLQQLPSGWRNNYYQPQTEVFNWGNTAIELNYRVTNNQFEITIANTRYEAQLLEQIGHQIVCLINQHRLTFTIADTPQILHLHNPHRGSITLEKISPFPEKQNVQVKGACTCPRPGEVGKVLVKGGDEYRGSTGYGKGFYEAIDYGGLEVDDVVAGRDWAVEMLPFVDPERVVYDSNTDPPYHLYDVDTGGLSDVSADELQVVGMPKLPGNLVLDQVDVIIRVRKPSS